MNKIILIIALSLFFIQYNFSQRLTLSHLTTICNKSNWENVNDYLNTLGWIYYDSKKGDDEHYNTITWSFEKDSYSDKAQAWFYLYTYESFPNKVSYSVFNKQSFDLIKNNLSANGFQLINSEINDNEIVSKYSNANFIIEITTSKRETEDYYNKTLTAYKIIVIKKAGVYDNDNGIKKTYFSNGNVEQEFNLKNGLINGNFKVYFENGKLKKSGSIYNKKRQGQFEEYLEDGTISAKYSCNNDMFNGAFSFYHENGKVKTTGNYVNDKKNGTFKEFDEDGNLIKETNWINGIQNGLERNYENGFQINELSFKNDILDGNYKLFYENSKQIKLTGSFKNGKKNAKFTIYSEQGKLDKEYSMLEDSLNGNYIEYYYPEKETFIFKYFGNYNLGQKQGKWKFAKYEKDKEIDLISQHNYENGVLEGSFRDVKKDSIIFGSYEKNLLNGKYVIYRSIKNWFFGGLSGDTTNCKILSEGSYYNGLKNGYWKEYEVSGSLLNEGRYQNDLQEGEWKYYYPNYVKTVNNISISEPYAKQLYLAEYYEKGKKNGKQIRYSFLKKSVINCDTTNDKSVNPLDTCYEYKYTKCFETAYYKNDLLQGPYEYKDSMSVVTSKGQFLKDLRDGIWFELSTNADSTKTKIEASYKEGKLHGKIIFKTIDDITYKTGYYENDKKTGLWSQYQPDGIRVWTTKNYSNDLLNGDWTEYYGNGNIKSVSNYKNDKLLKITAFKEQTNEKSSICEILKYKNNEYDCILTFYNNDTIVNYDYHFTNTFTEEIYDPLFFNMSINFSFKNDKGFRSGNFNRQLSNGKVLTKGAFKENNKIGTWFYYYYDQNIRTENVYENDKLIEEKYFNNSTNELFSGTFEEKHPNGKLALEIKVKKGLRHGKTKYYDENEKVLTVEKYEEGKLKEK